MKYRLFKNYKEFETPCRFGHALFLTDPCRLEYSVFYGSARLGDDAIPLYHGCQTCGRKNGHNKIVMDVGPRGCFSIAEKMKILLGNRCPHLGVERVWASVLLKVAKITLTTTCPIVFSLCASRLARTIKRDSAVVRPLVVEII